MADLDSLVRVRKHTVEQKQKIVAELYRRADELKAQKQTMLEQLDLEREKAGEMGVEMLSYFGPYEDAVKMRAEEIDEKMIALEARIQIALDDVRTAFSEYKKIEITSRKRKEQELAVLNKKENDALDEIAIEGFRRRTEE
ncbi:MAG: hypothetical protein CBB87_03380 [Micavibrio sp. TMED27]|nr:hypothetical protein [Micavibrio sp.]OUT91873.1 MAG: hypothetical protein CBB87_03380 [Micavibrio sp. TMED27]|tara:strand:- start:599 stop:1021 length:423 start_codon:yes stop_codon:yes gene_type:complete